ncbi:MAG TPA: hypothetical protein VK926_06945 [Gaiellaceae bacterium]|nr:hypothetical protein [Gaiellaceae bacterium]
MEASESTLVLDSSAVIALFRDEPTAPRVEQLLREERTRMSTITAAEPVAPSPDLATRAGELRTRIYDRRRRRVSLADSFVLAAATAGDTIVTTDGTLAAFADD